MEILPQDPSLPWGPSPHREILCLFLCLYLLSYPIQRRLASIFGGLSLLLLFRSCFIGVVPYSDEFFYVFVGRQVISPSSSSVIFFHLPLIHFEFIFVYFVREWSNFNLLHVAGQFSQHHL